MWKDPFLDKCSNGMTLAGNLLDTPCANSSKILETTGSLILFIPYSFKAATSNLSVKAVLPKLFHVRTYLEKDTVCTTRE